MVNKCSSCNGLGHRYGEPVLEAKSLQEGDKYVEKSRGVKVYQKVYCTECNGIGTSENEEE